MKSLALSRFKFSLIHHLHLCLTVCSVSPSSWPLPQLEPAQIRLIVYQDCERRGRNVLFDSSVKKKSTEDTPIAVSHVFMFRCWLDVTVGWVLLHQSIQQRDSDRSLAIL